jgi:hypothetical protein
VNDAAETIDSYIDMLKVLDFADVWTESMMIQRDVLGSAYENFCESEDKNTEHYRWAIFKEIISRKNLPTVDLQDLLRLVLSEYDGLLRFAMLHELIKTVDLLTEALHTIEERGNESLKKKIDKLLAIRRSAG